MWPLPPEVFAQGGAWALLALVVVMVLRGNLVPRSALRDQQATTRAAERERDAWREMAQSLTAQNQQLLGSTRVVHDVLTALPTPPPQPPAGRER